jgi:thiol-disulfide isomerase/thioredoxin
MNRIIIALSILLIILVLLYVRNRRSEGFESGKTLIICKADWCGHCKKAAPEFQKLLAASPITLKDGSKVVVKILDADKDKQEMAKFNVKGFPSILIVDKDSTTEYPGERTQGAIMDYLNTF